MQLVVDHAAGEGAETGGAEADGEHLPGPDFGTGSGALRFPQIADQEAPAFHQRAAPETAPARQALKPQVAVAPLGVLDPDAGRERPARVGQPEPNADVMRLGRDHDLGQLNRGRVELPEQVLNAVDGEIVAVPEHVGERFGLDGEHGGVGHIQHAARVAAVRADHGRHGGDAGRIGEIRFEHLGRCAAGADVGQPQRSPGFVGRPIVEGAIQRRAEGAPEHTQARRHDQQQREAPRLDGRAGQVPKHHLHRCAADLAGDPGEGGEQHGEQAEEEHRHGDHEHGRSDQQERILVEAAEQVFGHQRARVLQLEEEQRADAHDDQIQVVALEGRFVLRTRGGADVVDHCGAVGAPGGPEQREEREARAGRSPDVGLAGQLDAQPRAAGQPVERRRKAQQRDRFLGHERTESKSKRDEQHPLDRGNRHDVPEPRAAALEQRDLGLLALDDHRRDEHEVEQDDADDLEGQDEQWDGGEELFGFVGVEGLDDFGFDAGALDFLGDGFKRAAEAQRSLGGEVRGESGAVNERQDFEPRAQCGQVAGHRLDQRFARSEKRERVRRFRRHLEMVATDAPVALCVVDRSDDAHHFNGDRGRVVLPGRVDGAARPQLEAPGFGGALADRHFNGGRRVGRGGRARLRPAALQQLDLVLHPLEIEDAAAVSRILLRRHIAELGHKEGRRGERFNGAGDIVAGDPQPSVDRLERFVGEVASQPVRGVEHADINLRVGHAVEVRLQPELPQRAAVDHSAGHQRDGQNHADGHGRHQPAVAVEPSHGNPQRGGPGGENGAQHGRSFSERTRGRWPQR